MIKISAQKLMNNLYKFSKQIAQDNANLNRISASYASSFSSGKKSNELVVHNDENGNTETEGPHLDERRC
jgi:hypothetical protein